MRTVARGFSMAPCIRDGDVVTIAPYADRDPAVGDVVAFVTPVSARLAVHRVVARAGSGWLVRGDNAAQPDGMVARPEIFGRVVRVERGGRAVRLGFGREAAVIAALNRRGGWAGLLAGVRAARRAASGALRRAQRVPAWRAAGRRLRLRYSITVAATEEVRAVQRRLDPSAEPPAIREDANVTDWVAKRGGRVIGFVQYVHRPADYGAWAGHWLFALTVWGAYRGLGVGEALTRQVVARARERGAEELLLAVTETNQRAVALYRKLGFEPVVVPALEPAFEEEKAATGHRRIVMRKRLAEPGGVDAGAPSTETGSA